jgi:hypothetical protein
MHGAAVLSLAIAFACSLGGCMVEAVDEGDEELVGETESGLIEAPEPAQQILPPAIDLGDIELTAETSERGGGDEEDPQPDPWIPPHPDPEDDEDDDATHSSSSKSTIK